MNLKFNSRNFNKYSKQTFYQNWFDNSNDKFYAIEYIENLISSFIMKMLFHIKNVLKKKEQSNNIN